MQFPQAVRLYDFLARTRYKATRLTRVDVDDMQDDRTGRIDDIQEGCSFRTGAPRDNALSFIFQLLEAISPACHSRAERGIKGSA